MEDNLNVMDGSQLSDVERELALDNGIELSNIDAPVGEDARGEEPRESQAEAEQIDEPNGEDEQSPKAEENQEEEVASLDIEDPFASSDSNMPDEQEDEFKSLPPEFKKRLKRQKRTISRLEEQLNEAVERLNKFEAKTNEKPAQSQQLSRENFRTEQEYLDYMVENKLQSKIQEAQTQANQRAQAEAEEARMAQTWNTNVENAFKTEAEKLEYADNVASLGNLQEVLSQDVIEYIFSNPAGPKILNYLGQRPEVTASLRNMHEYDRGSALNSIKQYVSAERVKKPSQAPAPVGELGREGASRNNKTIEEMSEDELIKLYNSGKFPMPK